MLKAQDISVDRIDDARVELASIIDAGDRRSIEHWRERVSANPAWPDVRYQLACRYAFAGQFDAAIRELDSALAINSKFVDALRLKARLLSDRGELPAALAVMRRLNSTEEGSAETFLAEAYLLVRLGDRHSAIGAARNALELDRSSVEAQILLGEQYLALGDDRLGRRHLEIAANLKPSDETSYLTGLVCLKQEDPDGAEQHFRAALKINPRHLHSRIRLAMLKIQQQDFTEAHVLLTEAVAHYPRYPDLQYGLARVSLMLGRREEAYRLMMAALELNPGYAEARREIAGLCEGRSDEAADHAQRSIESDPADELAVINLGNLYGRQGEFDRGIEVLESAAERFPSSWRILQSLGILNLQRRTFPKAKLAFDAATQINPELGSIERSLRIVFKDDSLFEEERRKIDAKYSDPSEEAVRNHHLGRAHVDFHKEKLAARFLRQSLEAGYAPVENTVLLGTLAANQSDYVSAVRLLDPLRTSGFAESVRRLLLGLFHANSGDHEVSGRFYQQVMTDLPLFLHSLQGLAVSFREREEVEDMLDDYLDYARYNERSAPLFRRIGLAFAGKGMLFEARRHFEHATILDQQDAHAFHSLGSLALLRLDFDDATVWFKAAIDRDPEWALPQLSLALAHQEMGDHFSTIMALQRYIFLETTECWRELAVAWNTRLNVEHPH